MGASGALKKPSVQPISSVCSLSADRMSRTRDASEQITTRRFSSFGATSALTGMLEAMLERMRERPSHVTGT